MAWGWLLLLLTCLGAAGAGFLVGADVGNGQAWDDELALPAGRLGLQLQTGEASERLPAIDDDLRAMELEPPADDALRLLIALRGLENGGQPDWAKAEMLCSRLGWSRCDRAALQRMAAMK